jgi:hypothetical protein
VILKLNLSIFKKIYDSLYLDDGKEFKYIGFKDTKKKKKFFRELLIAINLLMNKLNDKYIIDDNMDFLKKIII